MPIQPATRSPVSVITGPPVLSSPSPSIVSAKSLLCQTHELLPLRLFHKPHEKKKIVSVVVFFSFVRNLIFNFVRFFYQRDRCKLKRNSFINKLYYATLHAHNRTRLSRRMKFSSIKKRIFFNSPINGQRQKLRTQSLCFIASLRIFFVHNCSHYRRMGFL